MEGEKQKARGHGVPKTAVGECLHRGAHGRRHSTKQTYVFTHSRLTPQTAPPAGHYKPISFINSKLGRQNNGNCQKGTFSLGNYIKNEINGI